MTPWSVKKKKTLVITRSSILLPQVRFYLFVSRGGSEGFQASSLTPDALSMKSQRMSGKLKSLLKKSLLKITN